MSVSPTNLPFSGPPAPLVGIIGGSGLSELPGLTDVTESTPETPYGHTSGPVYQGLLDGVPVAFLPRHGTAHSFMPTEVPYQANVYALKDLGVQYLISISAVGSLRDEMRPGDVVLVDQYIDVTRHRPVSFFGQGVVNHTSLADPTCPNLSIMVADAADSVKAASDTRTIHRAGTYVCIEGPQFSTRAESAMFRSWGADVVGMTNMPEAKLAREAELAYTSLTLVTDYDSWDATRPPANASEAMSILQSNTAYALKVLASAIKSIAQTPPESAAHTALDTSLVTAVENIPEHTKPFLLALLRRIEAKRREVPMN